MKPDKTLSAIYYSPRGYWKGLTAIKKLASAAKVTEQQAKDWLKKQAIWQIYLPAPGHIPRPKFDVAVQKRGPSSRPALLVTRPRKTENIPL